jgi:hypothetical protein
MITLITLYVYIEVLIRQLSLHNASVFSRRKVLVTNLKAVRSTNKQEMGIKGKISMLMDYVPRCPCSHFVIRLHDRLVNVLEELMA